MLDPSNKFHSITPVVALTVMGLLAGFTFLPACNRTVVHDVFAKCLTSKQVTLYGLYWCEHCAEQKKMFGSSIQYVTYVECGIQGSRAEEPACVQAGVKNFPTWKFTDGSMVEGVQPLQALSEKSGCTLP